MVDASSEPRPLEGDAGSGPARTDAGAPEFIPSSDAGATDAGSSLACDAVGELAGANGGCYLFAAEATSWSAASAACGAWGGTLARIDSPEEQALLSQNTSGDTWVGLNDLATEGDMLWDGGGALGTYRPWATDQPDDFDGSEDCVELLTAGRGWNDRPCTDLRVYVCQR